MPAPVVIIEKLVAGGDGLAHLADGRVVFVRAALPGEAVELELLAEKRDFARAGVLRVVDPSPDRAVPPCPALAAGCGGCAWQHVAPVHQLALKVEIVRDALRRTARLPEAEIRAAGTVPTWAYRTTVRLAAATSTRVGLRRAHDHRVVPLDDCLVAHPLLSELFGGLRLDAHSEVSLRVGLASGERSALVHPGRSSRPSRLSGLPADVAVGPAAVVHETVAGVSLQVGAPSFFQVGPEAAELLVATVGAACAGLPGRTMLDAYGGVGLFSATLADAADRLILVESSASACADARVNLAGRDATIECSTLEAWSPVPVDVVVADPARAGLGREAADRLAATAAARIVLVSCDPVAMARDSVLLADRGYRHVVTEVLDLFPNTPHIEAVTTFDRVPGTRTNPDG